MLVIVTHKQYTEYISHVPHPHALSDIINAKTTEWGLHGPSSYLNLISIIQNMGMFPMSTTVHHLRS
jgi:hypothetical protein